jgi:hypothetical protein
LPHTIADSRDITLASEARDAASGSGRTDAATIGAPTWRADLTRQHFAVDECVLSRSASR